MNCELPVRVRPIPVSITGATVPDCACELAGIDAGVLYLRSERQIAESSPIVVSFEHIRLSGVVAGCQAIEGDWMISIALASCRRRLDERIQTGEAGVIGIIGKGRTEHHICTIIDTSNFGLGIRLSFPVATGARVCVETESTMVLGEVRHCHGSDGQYVAGVLIIDVVPDERTQNQFSVMLNNLRWKLASSIRGRDIPAYRTDR